MRIAVIHGPNLNMLGVREPELYGTVTLAEIDGQIFALASELDIEVEAFQSNCEGAILDYLAQSRDRVDGVLVNPAGLGHTSVVLLDGLLATGRPFVEVHLTNPAAREAFRRRSRIAPAAVGTVAGLGLQSYLLGLRGLYHHIHEGDAKHR
ncbi:MAG: 3-dehydroquinate dehydratase [Gemmatimonadetes bacterium]|nr:3-dehydroquinate dehydratase [Gemmatimonadota bacterium]